MKSAKNTAFENRLAKATSPYLRQHARNPVDWFPWGEEAFAFARAQDKPIFLSIGYSTCHWCHVMAHESFEDPSVAEALSAGFVAIKLDREERPDVDQVYITACQLVRGSAGWPLTVLALPDGRPFFVATYIPKLSRPGRLGLIELLAHIETEWRTDRREILAAAHELTSAVGDALRPEALSPISLLDARALAVANLLGDFDHAHGGFGRSPKFPTPQKLLLLLMAARDGDQRAAQALRQTLDAMARGGLHDHLAGGFHRYATDRAWKLPHFEKTLYDQAMMLWVYAEAVAVLGNPEDKETALSTARYMLEALSLPSGALASGEDADSDGEEGLFYLWSLAELRAALTDGEAALVTQLYGATDLGNFADEATGRPTLRNVLHRHVSLAQVAANLEMTLEEAQALLATAHGKLLRVRQTRARPMRDDKQLSDWNGLAAVALARAGALLGEPLLVEAGAKVADAVVSTARGPNGRLSHVGLGAQVPGPGFLDDYAWMILACLELFEAKGEVRWRATALELAALLEALFVDPRSGALLLSAKDGERLFATPFVPLDSALPSGCSVALHALTRLAASTGSVELRRLAERALGPLSRTLASMPEAHALALMF